ncbi:hypothetical protein niasHT_021034 [Heterodera trifolii]|uniref:Uncharacterized protein n=1 Tax=Heterodera trifolii TaxID=157864 RepID=A0ABD2KCS6_9BILA
MPPPPSHENAGGGGIGPGAVPESPASPLAQLGRVLFNQQKVLIALNCPPRPSVPSFAAPPQIVQNGAAGHRVGVRPGPEKPLGPRLGQNVGHQREEKQREEEEEEKHWGKHFERKNGIGDF